MPSLILLLGGRGSRFGGKKQFLTHRGEPLYLHLLRRISDLFDEIVLVVPGEDLERIKKLHPEFKVTAGGKERQFSVLNGLKEVTRPLVVVHDGARPLAPRRLFEEALNLKDCDGKVPALPLRDTVKLVSPNGRTVEKTLPRDRLVAVQTPQGFKTKELFECHLRALEENFLGTDDASLLERCGKKVCLFEGDPKNLKITYPADWEIVKCLLEQKGPSDA